MESVKTCGRESCETVRAALEAEIERLRAELAECKEDAARYRWLRLRLEVRNERRRDGAFRKCIMTRFGRSMVDRELPYSATPGRDEQKAQELDAAIDAALAAKEAVQAKGGMTVMYWHNGTKIREYHASAVNQELNGEFQVLLNKAGQIIASYDRQCVVGIEHHEE